MPESTNILWNRELIDRYDLSGPRYTSYPTAPQFNEAFSETDLKQALLRSNQSGRPLSLYFHIPFCDTVCYYCACNKVITANHKRSKPYLERMIQEMKQMSELVDNTRVVHQLHWGGGTPTYLSDEEKRYLMDATRQYFNLLDDDTGEYSIEIHPGNMEVSTIACLREIGFNRLSMGIQDFNPKVQQAVNRFNSVDEVRELVEEARRLNFNSISMDLIYGLPHQNWQTFAATLNSVIDIKPDRLSVFNYAHMPHLFKTQKQINEADLPTPDEKLIMLENMTNKLINAGYVYIGMDHFALPDDELCIAQKEGHLRRNFQGYSTHEGSDLLAFGCSSISAVDNVFYQNHKQLDHYLAAIDKGQLPLARGFILSKDDQLRQQVIKQLICHFRLDFKTIEDDFNINFKQYFAEELQNLAAMIADGLIISHDNGITVTPAGRLLIRRICMTFDAYLNRNNEIKYSRII